MNKTELVDAVAASSGATKKDVAAVVDDVIKTVAATLRSGDKVQLAGLGVFKPKLRNARIARNPATGVAVDVPARKVVTFTTAKDLQDTL